MVNAPEGLNQVGFLPKRFLPKRFLPKRFLPKRFLPKRLRTFAKLTSPKLQISQEIILVEPVLR